MRDVGIVHVCRVLASEGAAALSCPHTSDPTTQQRKKDGIGYCQVDAKSSQLGDAPLLPDGLSNRVQSHNSANRGLVKVGLKARWFFREGLNLGGAAEFERMPSVLCWFNQDQRVCRL